MGKLASAPVVDISRGAKLDLRASQRRDRLVGRPLPLRAVAGLRLWRQTVARDLGPWFRTPQCLRQRGRGRAAGVEHVGHE